MAHPLIDELAAANQSIDALVKEFGDEMESTLTEAGITEGDLKNATKAELETLARTVLLDHYRSEAVDKAKEAGDVLAWAYLGPDDKITRPFCEELLGTSLTEDQIGELDNQQDLDPMTSCGGYNCRHQWLPLYDPDEVGQYPEGDVEAANEAAKNG